MPSNDENRRNRPAGSPEPRLRKSRNRSSRSRRSGSSSRKKQSQTSDLPPDDSLGGLFIGFFRAIWTAVRGKPKSKSAPGGGRKNHRSGHRHQQPSRKHRRRTSMPDRKLHPSFEEDPRKQSIEADDQALRYARPSARSTENANETIGSFEESEDSDGGDQTRRRKRGRRKVSHRRGGSKGGSSIHPLNPAIEESFSKRTQQPMEDLNGRYSRGSVRESGNSQREKQPRRRGRRRRRNSSKD